LCFVRKSSNAIGARVSASAARTNYANATMSAFLSGGPIAAEGIRQADEISVFSPSSAPRHSQHRDPPPCSTAAAHCCCYRGHSAASSKSKFSSVFCERCASLCQFSTRTFSSWRTKTRRTQGEQNGGARIAERYHAHARCSCSAGWWRNQSASAPRPWRREGICERASRQQARMS
jgi:hypothetical protein